MIRRRPGSLVVPVLATIAAAGLVWVAAPAWASAPSSPQVTTTKTVQASLSASGEVQTARLFTQISVEGQGDVTVSDPTSTQGLRNLDGFSSPTVTGGKAVYNVSVDGVSNIRTVADFNQDLPIAVAVTYLLDGEPIDPSDLAGRSGLLSVSYHVENTTAKPTTISYQNGKGEAQTDTVDLVTPYVGQLQIPLPSSFSAVDAPRADIAGDGRGGKLLTWTMVLFEPIGQVQQTFGFTAQVTNLRLPPATVQALPVPPQRKPELKFGQDGFQQGARTATALTQGATKIDANLIKLADGAGQLMSGLAQLADGANQLNQGLSDQAVPGAEQLAAGLNDELVPGSERLVEGLQKLQAGTTKLSGATEKAYKGSQQLTAGSQQVAAGAHKVSGGADAVSAGAQKLAGGIGQVSGGLGQLADASTGLPAVLDGLEQLRLGLTNPSCNLANPTNPANPCGLEQVLSILAAGLSNPGCSLANPTDPANPCGVKEALGLVRLGISNPACSLANPTDPANPCGVRQVVNAVGTQLTGAAANGGSISQLTNAAIGAYQQMTSPNLGGAACPTNGAVPVPPVLPPSVLMSPPLNLPASDPCVLQSQVVYGLGLPAGAVTPTDPGGLRAQTAAAGGALGQVVLGIDNQLLPSVTQIITAVSTLYAGEVSARNAVANQLVPGVDQLIAGVTAAVAGVNQLDAGAGQLDTGATALATGASKVAGGAQDVSNGATLVADGQVILTNGLRRIAVGTDVLAGGMSQAETGAQQLSTGIGQAASGATTLSSGLQAASTGSAQLAAGATKAEDGANQVAAGATKLQVKGSARLVAAGNGSAGEFAKKYAEMQALNAKAADGALPYGAPANSQANAAAYDLTIAGIDNSRRSNTGRALGALILLGLGAAAGIFLRSRVA